MCFCSTGLAPHCRLGPCLCLPPTPAPLVKQKGYPGNPSTPLLFGLATIGQSRSHDKLPSPGQGHHLAPVRRATGSKCENGFGGGGRGICKILFHSISPTKKGRRLGLDVFMAFLTLSLWDRGTSNTRFTNCFFRINFPEQPRPALLETITGLTNPVNLLHRHSCLVHSQWLVCLSVF